MPYKIRTTSAQPLTIPDATETSDGVMTSLQVQRLNASGAWTITAIQTHDYNASIGEFVRVATVERSVTVTFPASSVATAGQSIAVKNVGGANGQTITITPTGGDTIDGQASASMTTNLASLTFVDNGDGNFSIQAQVS